MTQEMMNKMTQEELDSFLKEMDKQWDVAMNRANKLAKENNIDICYEANDGELYELFEDGFDVNDSELLKRIKFQA